MPEPNRPRFDAKPVTGVTHGPLAAASDSALREAAVRQFVARVGGLENARQALELWAMLTATGRRGPKAA